MMGLQEAPRLTRATQLIRPAIVEEALPHLTRGDVLTINHRQQKAVLIGIGEPVHLDYYACLRHTEELAEAAYRVGTHTMEMGRRPEYIPKPTAAMPEATERIAAAPETEAAEWLTTKEVQGRYPHVVINGPRLSGYERGGRVQKRFTERGTEWCLSEEIAEMLRESSELNRADMEADAVEPEGDALPAAVGVALTRPPEVDESRETILSEPKTAAEWLRAPDAKPAAPEPAQMHGANVQLRVHTPRPVIEQGTFFRLNLMSVELDERGITSSELMDTLTAAEARTLAALLTRAADEMEAA